MKYAGFFIWVFIMLCSVFLPALLIRGGREALNHPSKAIDPKHGYRTVMSMKNQDTWEFAQQYVGRLSRIMGWPLAIFTVLFLLWLFWQAACRNFGAEDLMWWTLLPAGVEIAAVAAFRPLAERALKRNFDENGNRR